MPVVSTENASTTQKEETPAGFVRSKLPWITAAGAFLIYLVTLNHWVNLRSLQVVAKVTGWDWAPPVQWPVFFAVTYPFRWLPDAWQPIALNVFSAFCAALTLGLLARCVALLPHDRTHDQRIRERSENSLLSIKGAWLPPVLAVLVCGLQLTFWEHATALTGEMLGLLMFAYCARSLLEYRVSQNALWLVKMAFVYGLGVTNNWAMIGFFPVFLVALIWILGPRFFSLEIFGKMFLAGLAGLLFYLVLPVVWMATQSSDFGFFEVLRANFSTQKLFLWDASALRNRALLLSLTSVLPLLLIGIRWPTSFGDTSAAGATLTIVMFRVVHLFFLGVCIWVAFDPKFSPRELGHGVPFLTFYWIAALAIGYYAGYALLVFTDLPKKSYRRQSDFSKLINPVVRAAVWALLIAVPAGLVYKNYGDVQASNGKLLQQYMARVAKGLPSEPAYLLSDDPAQILLFEGYFRTSGLDHQHVLVNTRSLQSPSYHEQLEKHYGERWPGIGPLEEHGARVEDLVLQDLIADLAEAHPLIYLHPSFGYFFEKVYLQPEGPLYPLALYNPDQILPPAITPRQAERNQEYWNSAPEHFDRVAKLAHEEVQDAAWLAGEYSRAINYWGVRMQKLNKLKEAENLFNRALRLNTNNVAAYVNLEFNRLLQAGSTNQIDPRSLEALFGKFPTVDTLLAENGPFDEPRFRSWLGGIFMTQSLFRQGIQQFTRVIHFQPTNFMARAAIARALVYGNWPDMALSEIERIRSDFPELPATNRIELVSIEATAHFAKEDFEMTEQLLTTARQRNPGNLSVAKSLYDFYRTSRRWTNALQVLDEELAASPTNVFLRMQKAETYLAMKDYDAAGQILDNVLEQNNGFVPALLSKAFISIQRKDYDSGLEWVNQVLRATPDHKQALAYRGMFHLEQKNYEEALEDLNAVLEENPGHLAALRNRALLYLRTKQYEQARGDYERLRDIIPRAYAVHYGLAEIAYQEQDFEKAAKHYERYLKYVPENATGDLKRERDEVAARLSEIKSGE